MRLPIVIRDRDVVERARDLYAVVPSVGWPDCLIAAYAIERGDSDLLTFDRGFDRIPGVKRTVPPSAGTTYGQA